MLATEYYIGLMSGTSLDGMDAALVRIEHQSGRIERFELRHSVCIELPDTLCEELKELSQAPLVSFEALSQSSIAIAKLSNQAVQKILDESGQKANDVTAIGSHGITLRHLPELGYSWQLGEPNLLAHESQIDVVADLRMADIAAGGQGAPLVPAFHRQLFKDADDTMVLNLGGIANLSVLSAKHPLAGFDTGPANTLLDLWCQRHTGRKYDKDAEFGLSGNLSTELLSIMMQEPFLGYSAPKSTDRKSVV